MNGKTLGNFNKAVAEANIDSVLWIVTSDGKFGEGK